MKMAVSIYGMGITLSFDARAAYFCHRAATQLHELLHQTFTEPAGTNLDLTRVRLSVVLYEESEVTRSTVALFPNAFKNALLTLRGDMRSFSCHSGGHWFFRCGCSRKAITV